MTISVEVQFAVKHTMLPSLADFQKWAAAIPSKDVEFTACIRIVGEGEAKKLNKEYRNINKATNVLSFQASIPKEIGINILGDVVICAPVIYQEALEQNKDQYSHWAHMLIHGILHLQGYDHQNASQAEVMEALEIKTLEKFEIKNPY